MFSLNFRSLTTGLALAKNGGYLKFGGNLITAKNDKSANSRIS